MRDNRGGVSSSAYSLCQVTILRRTCAGFVKREDSCHLSRIVRATLLVVYSLAWNPGEP